LCALEKLVHVEDPALLPDLAMVRYEAPDDLPVARIGVAELPPDWRRREALTQRRGDDWYSSGVAPLLQVPSAIVPLDRSPDLNVVLNHRHSRAAEVRITEVVDFTLDLRLL
jgi:hypothetical protein